MKIRQNPLWGFGRKLYESTEYYWSIQKISSRGFNRIILEDSTEFMQFYRISMGELLLFYALPVECNRMLLKDSTKSFPKYSTESIRKVQPKRSREFHRISSVNSSESFTGDTNINVDKVSVRILSSSQRKKTWILSRYCRYILSTDRKRWPCTPVRHSQQTLAMADFAP